MGPFVRMTLRGCEAELDLGAYRRRAVRRMDGRHVSNDRCLLHVVRQCTWRVVCPVYVACCMPVVRGVLCDTCTWRVAWHVYVHSYGAFCMAHVRGVSYDLSKILTLSTRSVNDRYLRGMPCLSAHVR